MPTTKPAPGSGKGPRPRLVVATKTGNGIEVSVKHSKLHSAQRKKLLGSEADVARVEDRCLYLLRDQQFTSEVQRKLVAQAVLRTIRLSHSSARQILTQMGQVLQLSEKIQSGEKGEARAENRKLWSRFGLVVGPGGIVHRPAKGGFKDTITSIQDMKRQRATNADIVRNIKSVLLARFGALEPLLSGEGAVDLSRADPFRYIYRVEGDESKSPVFGAEKVLEEDLDKVYSLTRDSPIVADLLATIKKINAQNYTAKLSTSKLDPRMQRQVEGLEYTRQQLTADKNRAKSKLDKIVFRGKLKYLTEEQRALKAKLAKEIDELTKELFVVNQDLEEAHKLARSAASRQMSTAGKRRNLDMKLLVRRAGFKGKGAIRPVRLYQPSDARFDALDENTYLITRQSLINARRRRNAPEQSTIEVINGKPWQIASYPGKLSKALRTKVKPPEPKAKFMTTRQINQSRRAVNRRARRSESAVGHDKVDRHVGGSVATTDPRKTQLGSVHGSITDTNNHPDELPQMSTRFAHLKSEPFAVQVGDEMTVTYTIERDVVRSDNVPYSTITSGTFIYSVPTSHLGRCKRETAHLFYSFLEDERSEGFPIGDTRVNMLYCRNNSYGVCTTHFVRFTVHKRSGPRLSQIASSHGEISEGDDMSIPKPDKKKWVKRPTCSAAGCKNLARCGRETCIYHPDKDDKPCDMEGCARFTTNNRALCAMCFQTVSHVCRYPGCKKRALHEFCHAHRDGVTARSAAVVEGPVAITELVGETVESAVMTLHPIIRDVGDELDDSETDDDDSSSTPSTPAASAETNGITSSPASVPPSESAWDKRLKEIIEDLGDDFAGTKDPGTENGVEWGLAASCYRDQVDCRSLFGTGIAHIRTYDATIVCGKEDEAFNPPVITKVVHRGGIIKCHGKARRTPLDQDLTNRTRLVFLSRDRDMSNPMLWNEIPSSDADTWKSFEFQDDDGVVFLPSQETINGPARLISLMASYALGVVAANSTPQARAVWGAASVAAAAYGFLNRETPKRDKNDPYYVKREGAYFVHIVDVCDEVSIGQVKDDLRLPHQKTVALRAPGISSRIIHRMAHVVPEQFHKLSLEDRALGKFFYKVADYDVDHIKVADCYYEGARDLRRTVEVSTQRSAANHTINIPWRSKTSQLGEELYYKARFFYNFSKMSSRPLNCASW